MTASESPKLACAIIVASMGIASVVGGQTWSVPSPVEVARVLGFTEGEISRINNGEIVTKDLKEGSDKELAGVLAMVFKQPVAELASIALEGTMLDSDPSIRAHRSWAPETSADEAFTAVALDAKEADEAARYTRASAGSQLNLSTEEIDLFKKLKPDQINAELRSMLTVRYEAYRKNGLKGIAPYARGGNNTASPAAELMLAIKEAMPAAHRDDYFNALLNYPANPLPKVVHRFHWFKQQVEGRPALILAHRASLLGERVALLTEEQYYVSHSYDSNFIVSGCLAVEGGTLVFYVNRSFTDQVAGMGSGLKHGIGRKQMLSEVAANLKRVREQLQK